MVNDMVPNGCSLLGNWDGRDERPVVSLTAMTIGGEGAKIPTAVVPMSSDPSLSLPATTPMAAAAKRRNSRGSK